MNGSDPAPGTIAAFEESVWEPDVREALEAARDVAAIRLRRAKELKGGLVTSVAEDEDDALRRLADQPAFAWLRPTLPTKVDQGRWIMTRILHATEALRQELPSDRPVTEWSPAQKAVLLWADALSQGLRPGDLAARYPDLLPGHRGTSAEAGAMRVRSTMWLRGNRRAGRAGDGIRQVYYAVITALRQPETAPPSPDDVTFDYWWERLGLDGPSGERQLLVLLAQLAGDVPVPLTFIRRGWEPLPSPLRSQARDAAVLERIVTALSRRGLVGRTSDGVICSISTRQRVRSTLTTAEEGSAASVAMRFIKAALPPDTHHHASWPLWADAEQHVRSAIDGARRARRRLDDAAHMLDRLAVYLRETHRLGEAITTGREAVALADETGRPDLIEYGIYLGNLAMALRSGNRLQEALEVMDRSLEVTAQSVGTEHEEYAGSLNIKGNLLGAMRRHREEMTAHDEALDIIRRVAAVRPSDALSTLIETLNDTASALLRRHDADSTSRALLLLDEAEGLIGRGEYGWRQIRLNRAKGLRTAGRLDEAEPLLRDLVAFAEQAHGDPSLPLFAALAALAEVLEDKGDPEHEARSSFARTRSTTPCRTSPTRTTRPPKTESGRDGLRSTDAASTISLAEPQQGSQAPSRNGAIGEREPMSS